MEKRIILFLVLSMAVIVLYPYLLEKLGLAKRPAPAAPRAVTPKKDTAAPATVTATAPPARVPTPATEAREQEVTGETDLVKVVLSNRGGVIKRWELKRYLTSDARDPKPIQLVPAMAKDVSFTLPLTVEVPDAKLQERLSRGLYAVSAKDVALTVAQPAADIGFSYTDPETSARVSKRLTFHHDSYLVDLVMETAGVASSTTLSLGTNFGIHEWQEGFVGFIGPASYISGKLNKYRLFVGPKEYDTLAALKLELEETIDFGWFIYGSWSIVRSVAKPLFYAIRYLHEITHNYGVAIILITVFIKLLLAPLAYKSYKSMKDMAAVQPEMMALQKKYADDRERLNKELMKFYKERKVNPVGGCLPILMGVTMFIQQKIQPTTMDPKQAQIMLLLPVFLTFLFITFPAGLVLYWLTNNVLTIAQQVITDRYLLPRTAVPAIK